MSKSREGLRLCYSRDIPAGWPRENTDVTFVDTLEGAVETAKQLAGDKVVGVAGTGTVRRLLNAGPLDGVTLSVIPVLLGSGHRFFDGLANTPIALEGPEVIEGDGVTHLNYRVLGPISTSE